MSVSCVPGSWNGLEGPELAGEFGYVPLLAGEGGYGELGDMKEPPPPPPPLLLPPPLCGWLKDSGKVVCRRFCVS